MSCNEDEDACEGLPTCVAVQVERDTGYGSVPGLEDEELADPAELERQVMIAEWGPILALPVQSCRGGFRPAIDEFGNLDWGAYGTVDFLRLRGPFDKARYKAEKLKEDLRMAVIMLGTISARMPVAVVTRLQQRLREPGIDLDSFTDEDEHGFARWYLRARGLRALIRELRECSYRQGAGSRPRWW